MPVFVRRRLLAAIAAVLAVAGTVSALVVTTRADSAASRPRLVSAAGVRRHDFAQPDGRRIIAFWNPQELAVGAPDTHPWIAYVHGGGWRYGAVDEPTAIAFCDRMVAIGLTCFSLDYTLLPHAVWPTQGRQVVQQLAWVRRHGATFHLSSRLGFIAGHSAGGLMAGVAGLADGHLAGIVSLAGATNVPYVALHDPDRNVARYARQLVRDAPLTSALARSATVVAHVGPRTPRVPYLIVQERGDHAVGVGTSRLLAAQLRRLHFPVTLDVFGGRSHQVNVSGPAVDAVDNWLAARIARLRTPVRKA